MRQGNVFSLGMQLFRLGDSMKTLHIWSPNSTTSSAFCRLHLPHAETDFGGILLSRSA